ncbi:MAG: glycosyltransferase [Thermoanaerobaculia bacterium]
MSRPTSRSSSFCNERENLPILVDELVRMMDSLAATSFEVILIDDCGDDGGLDAAMGLAASEPRLRLLRHAGNYGQSAALASGFAAARGGIVVTLDADLQNDPADVPRLLEALRECDLVSGVRAERHDSWMRRVSSRLANRVRSAILHDGITDVGCSLKAYRAELLVELPLFNGMHRFLPALVALRGARIREIPVRHRPRRHGTSKYGVHNRLWRGLADLRGVRWLQKRSIGNRRVQEIE